MNTTNTNIILATDHAGFEMKGRIKQRLQRDGYAVEDVGAHAHDPADDYPVYMREAAKLVVASDAAVGVVFGGSGQGEAMVMNRHRGVRAMVYAAHDPRIVRAGREHNDANVLSLGTRFLTYEQAEEAVALFLTIGFSGDERHARRIGQMDG